MTRSSYRDQLDELRRMFPAPQADAESDERFVRALAEAVNRALRMRGPGARLAVDDESDGPHEQAALSTEPASAHETLAELLQLLHGLPLEVHPRGQVNVNCQPSSISLIGSLLPTIFNPNLSSDGRGAGCSLAERQIVAQLSEWLGYDPARSGGVFTFGGTGTLLYGVKLGLEKACPGTLRQGLRGDVAVLASQRCHHTCLTAAGWLGIGSDHVHRLPVSDDNAMQIAELQRVARECLRSGRRLAAIVATVGTTDAFGLDDVARIAQVRDELVDEFHLDYRPHLHADAVIGWAWSAFQDYDLTENPLGWSAPVLDGLRTAAPRIRALAQSDSLGVDFHKTGFVPYISSLFLVRDQQDFEQVARPRELMPYLFHSGRHHPGLFTLETTRAAGGVMAAWSNLRWLGRPGLRTLLGHALEMTAELRSLLRAQPETVIVNHQNVGPVTLFRVYPSSVDAAEQWRRERDDPAAGELVEQNNEYVRQVHQAANARATAGGASVGLTRLASQAASGRPLVALKSYLLSPWLESSDVHAILDQVAMARHALT